MADLFRGFVGDGAPIEQVFQLKDMEADSEDARYDKILLLVGVFHFYMEVLKKMIQLSEEVLTFLVQQYIGKKDNDATTKNIDYYLGFNDPTTIEKDLGVVIFALLQTAIRELCKTGVEEMCSGAVYQHMGKCSTDAVWKSQIATAFNLQATKLLFIVVTVVVLTVWYWYCCGCCLLSKCHLSCSLHYHSCHSHY